MRNRLARLEAIYTYLLSHPYSTCARIATYLSRRVDLIQNDVRTLYRSGWLKRYKVEIEPAAHCDDDNSMPRRFIHLGHEYCVTQPDRKFTVPGHKRDS